jgi:DNA-directed RNA polymerase specialized sigma24 family protein
MIVETLNTEEKEQLIDSLKDAIPKMTRRQIECWILCQLGFTQEESGVVLNCTKQNINLHLASIWNIFEKY